MTNDLFLDSNIKRDVTVEEIKNLFTVYGSIASYNLLRSQKAEPALHYDLLIEFAGENYLLAQSAVKAMNGHIIGGEYHFFS